MNRKIKIITLGDAVSSFAKRQFSEINSVEIFSFAEIKSSSLSKFKKTIKSLSKKRL